MCDNCYYVYEWIRMDDNTTFYVGKGKGNRAFVLKKNNTRFMNIYNSVETAVTIVEENLMDEEAKYLEREYIEDYVFNQGYAICISGYRESEVGELANCTWGGEGTSGRVCKTTTRIKISKANAGKSHPQTEQTKMIISYKLRMHKKTKEHCQNISKALKGRTVNSISLEKMILWAKTAKRTEKHKQNISLSLSGKPKTEEHKRKLSEGRILKGAWKGKNNPKAKSIKMIFPNGDIKEFDTMDEAIDIVPRTIMRKCFKSGKPYEVPKCCKKKYGHLEGVIIMETNK